MSLLFEDDVFSFSRSFLLSWLGRHVSMPSPFFLRTTHAVSLLSENNVHPLKVSYRLFFVEDNVDPFKVSYCLFC